MITSPASVAWLLNVRGGDVPHTPLPLGRAILYSSGAVDLFIEREKISPGLDATLGNGCVIRPPSEFLPALAALGGKTVSADPGSAPSAVFAALGDAKATSNAAWIRALRRARSRTPPRSPARVPRMRAMARRFRVFCIGFRAKAQAAS